MHIGVFRKRLHFFAARPKHGKLGIIGRMVHTDPPDRRVFLLNLRKEFERQMSRVVHAVFHFRFGVIGLDFFCLVFRNRNSGIPPAAARNEIRRSQSFRVGIAIKPFF